MYKIELDYQTGIVKMPKKKPKVGDFLQMTFINLPTTKKVAVSYEFSDKNMEYASSFSGFLDKGIKSIDDKDKAEPTKIEAIKILEKTSDTVKKIEAEVEKKLRADSVEAARLDFNSTTLKEFKLNPTVKLMAGIDWIREEITLSKNINDKTSRNKKIDELTQELKLATDYNVNVVKDLKKYLNTLLQTGKASTDSIDQSIKILEKAKTTKEPTIRQPFNIQAIQIANNDISTIKIQYREIEKDKESLETERSLVIKNRGGFKLDFSTGFMATGLKDDNYRVVPTKTDTTELIDDKKGNFVMGFGLLAHAYMRSGCRFNGSITTGLLLNTNSQTLNYVAGLSALLGLEQRFVLTGGFVFGKVKRLTRNFEVGKRYSTTQLNTVSGVPYTERYQAGWFVGVSYNLGGITNTGTKSVAAN